MKIRSYFKRSKAICGMSKFGDDVCVATVFDRADQKMYDDKASLKGGGKL